MHAQDIEANLMKRDIAKAQLRAAHDQPAAVAKAMEMNDANAMRRRGRMMLPAPQVGDCTLSSDFAIIWKDLSMTLLCLVTHKSSSLSVFKG